MIGYLILVGLIVGIATGIGVGALIGLVFPTGWHRDDVYWRHRR